jgi:hypothetical protein
LRGIDQEELNRVFQAWVQRVQEVSEGNGDSSHEKISTTTRDDVAERIKEQKPAND